MTSLTISIDESLLRRARIRALEHGTSVNALLRDYLEAYATPDSQQQAVANFLVTAQSAHGSSGGGGRTWTREDLHRY